MTLKKILIANRGEIAIRIIQAAEEMKIKTVAIYSEGDADALHPKRADEAVCVGPVESQKSYLHIPKIMEVARDLKVDAIHPGYGFLSEKAEFAKAVKKAGITFIGPDAELIDQMGDKVAARALMEKAGVPIVPGTGGLDDIESAEKAVLKLLKERQDFQFPLLIKAAGGGGGKGMRVCHKKEDLRTNLERAQSESIKSFNNSTIFVERYIEEPRHIEVQILGDGKNAIHLYERECSLQRRHQKVIEEAPSPSLTDSLRHKILDAAVKAAVSVNYSSAGTIEFIVSPQDDFYFLEMNTRIQVEHPVTEEITGIDLVKEQIRIASGEKLGWSQKDIRQTGHAIEARLYAEDTEKGFLPQPGKLHFLRFPQRKGVRVDTGVESPTTISSFYDPMIAKITAWGETREAARRKLHAFLCEVYLEGLITNRSFLIEVIDTPFFIEGKYHTHLLEDKSWRKKTKSSPQILAALCLKDYLDSALELQASKRSLWQTQEAD